MAKCPHCEGKIVLDPAAKRDAHNEVRREVRGLVKKEILYSCPHCEKVLGFAYFQGGLGTGRP